MCPGVLAHPHVVRPDLEKQQVAHVRLAVPLRAQLASALHTLHASPSFRSVGHELLRVYSFDCLESAVG